MEPLFTIKMKYSNDTKSITRYGCTADMMWDLIGGLESDNLVKLKVIREA